MADSTLIDRDEVEKIDRLYDTAIQLKSLLGMAKQAPDTLKLIGEDEREGFLIACHTLAERICSQAGEIAPLTTDGGANV